MLFLLHLGDEISPLEEGRGSVPSGENHLNIRRLLVEEAVDVLLADQTEVESDVDLIQDEDPELSREHGPQAFFKTPLGSFDVLVVGGFGDVDESFAAKLFDGDERGQFSNGAQFTVGMSFKELTDIDPEAMAGSAEGQAKGGCGFALTVSGVNLKVSLEVLDWPARFSSHALVLF